MVQVRGIPNPKLEIRSSEFFFRKFETRPQFGKKFGTKADLVRSSEKSSEQKLTASAVQHLDKSFRILLTSKKQFVAPGVGRVWNFFQLGPNFASSADRGITSEIMQLFKWNKG